MGSGKHYDLHEVFRDSSSQQMKKHRQMIQAFLDRGYEIEFQEKKKDMTAQNQLVATHLTTILKPTKNFELPLIKLEASEVFGKYFDDRDDFYPHDEPHYQVKIFQKSARLTEFNAPWMPMTLE